MIGKGSQIRLVTVEQELGLPVGPYIFIIDLGDGSKPTRGWLYINY